ncbi:MAG: TetR/AcrR family transcriptional regulator [Candidatus Binatia bacterium]
MPRRTAADAAVTRSDILRAARKLFAARGYAATTTGEIATAAGVTAGALFHHFDGKLGLFRSVFEDLETELDAHVRATAGEVGGLEAFLKGFRAYLEFAKRRDFHRIVMLEGPGVLGEAEWHAIEVRRGATTLMEGLETLVAEGVVEDRPRRPLGLLLLGAMGEAGFEVARKGTARDMDGLVDAMRYLLAPHMGKRARAVAAPTARTRPRK